MKRTLTLLWMVAGMTCCRFAAAGTIYGPSGLIFNPSAYVPSNKAVSLGTTTFTVTPPGAARRWLSSTLDAGVGGRGEVGLTYLHRSGGGLNSGFGGFAKYQLQKESVGKPAVAVGVDLIGGDLKTTQAYLVGSKRLTAEGNAHPFTLTLGVIGVRDRDGVRRDDADFFGGFDVRISQSLSLVTEWRSRTDGYRTHNSGVMLMYGSKKFGLAVGYVNNGSSTSHRFFIGAGYNVSTLD
jgi:hypothetical protein